MVVIVMFVFAVFYVILNSFCCCASYAPTKITFAPEFISPQIFSKQIPVILSHHVRREALYLLNQFAWGYVLAISDEDMPLFEKFLDMLNDLDDVQNVYHNAEV